MKEAIIAFLVALVLGAGINSLPGMSPPPPPPENQPATNETSSNDAQNVTPTSDQTFDQDVLANNQPVLVDFYSDSCGPCKMMAPVVSKLASQYDGRVKFMRLDVDSNPSITGKYNVTAIPTLIIFSKGQRGESFCGVIPKERLATAIDKSFQ
jgi:thioredoxin 1